MAKRTSKASNRGKRPSTAGPVETLDERDTRTAAERRAAREETAERQREDEARGNETVEGPEGEVDNDQLPITHQTIMDHRDTQLPPEATPREGRTSPAPPLSPAVRRDLEPGAVDQDDRSRLVQATAMGYYDHTRRRAGDVFRIHPDAFSDRWMRDVPKGTRERVTTANQAIAEQNQATRALRAGAFPSTPNAQRPTNASPNVPGSRSLTEGIDQAAEPSPLED